MIKVNSRIDLNMNQIKALEQAQIQALEQTAGSLLEEIQQAQVIPRDKGTLQGAAFFCDFSQSNTGTVSLVHDTLYARRLYFHPEYRFKDNENPNAKGKWFEDWQKGGKYEDYAIKKYAEIYRGIAGL